MRATLLAIIIMVVAEEAKKERQQEITLARLFVDPACKYPTCDEEIAGGSFRLSGAN